ncbi:MAG: DinB family protein [Acidobacteriaceae bacterium]
MAKTDDAALRGQLISLLKGRQAHAALSDAVADFPLNRISERPAGSPYSAWQLLEHIRITLHDLLEFATNSEYAELEWPGGYWPRDAAPDRDESWSATVKAIQADMNSFEALIHSPDSNLYAAIPWGKNGETLLREVLLAADHTSYHLGELILLRRVLGIWNR